MDSRTSIILVTYNQLDYTKMCIASIREFTTPGTYEIIVIDNNSSDATQAWLRMQPDIITVFNGDNLGFPKACNQGIKCASSENDILLLNNDTVVTYNWLNNLKTCLCKHDIGIVGPITNNCSYYQAIKVEYTNLDEMQKFAYTYNKSNPTLWESRLKLIGFCMLIKREVINKIGILDERFSPGHYEDDDFSVRARRAGYKLLLCKDTFIHHFGSVSFREDREKFRNITQVGMQKFRNKWGFDAERSSYIHHEIASLIEENQNASFNILEVNCGCGGTLLQLKDRYPKANLFGTVSNDSELTDASLIAKVNSIDIEKEELLCPEEYFDYVLMADVLQTYRDPWGVLKRLSKYIKPTGTILVSIPNMGHYSVIGALLNGQWTYDNGNSLMDKENVRFFTYNDIIKLFKEAGFDNLLIKSLVLQGNEESKKFVEQLVRLSNIAIENQYITYKYLIKAERNLICSVDKTDN